MVRCQQRDDLLPYERLDHHQLRACQPGLDALQDSVALAEEGDGNHCVESRLAFQVLQHIEAVHSGEIEAEKEQVGWSAPEEEPQHLHGGIEADDLVTLTTQDDLEDLARGRRCVQHDDPQLPLHARPSLLLHASPHSPPSRSPLLR